MSKKHFVWIDLEMTGLNPDIDTILEIATIITDDQLELVAQGPHYIIHQPDNILNAMIPVVQELHKNSGLTQAVRESSISLQQAEKDTFTFIQQHAHKRKAYLAGNSVWQDRMFLQKYMPSIIDHLHYRLLDVTSFKIAMNAWYPQKEDFEYKKEDKHRALSDIKESIKELAFYKKQFFM